MQNEAKRGQNVNALFLFFTKKVVQRGNVTLLTHRLCKIIRCHIFLGAKTRGNDAVTGMRNMLKIDSDDSQHMFPFMLTKHCV